MDFVMLISFLFAGLVDTIMVIAFIISAMKTKNPQSMVADTVVVLAMIVNVICVYLSFRGIR